METNTTTSPAKKSDKKVWKIVAWVAGGVILLALLAFAAISLWSRAAADNYRTAAADQLNTLIGSNGSTTQVKAVTLQSVPLANVVNPDYDRINDLQSSYQQLLAHVENYLATLSAHNEFVHQYNEMLAAAAKSDATPADIANRLNEMADTLTTYAKSVQSADSTQTTQINELNDLAAKCLTAATDVQNGNMNAYKTVMSAGSEIIQRYETALNSERQTIDQDLSDFQSKINQ